jgi:predicted nucleic acid-binding protein
MPKIVIADTSTLILFKKIEKFELLKSVYTSLIVTPEIAAEFGKPLPKWIKIQAVTDIKYQALLDLQLDKGEASAITLATEIGGALLLLDDLKARKLAKKIGLRFTGTLGIIHRAKEIGVVPKIKPLIDKLLETDFRISQTVVSELLKINNEN